MKLIFDESIVKSENICFQKKMMFELRTTEILYIKTLASKLHFSIVLICVRIHNSI